MFVISSAIAKGNFLLLITPLDVISLLCGYALHFAVWKIFHFEDVFCLPPAVHLDKQVSIPWLFSCFVE